VACRAGTTKWFVFPARQAENRFLGPVKGLQIRALFATQASVKMDVLYVVQQLPIIYY